MARPMNAAAVFAIVSAFAGLAWLFLIAAARWLPRAFAVVRVLVPVSLSLIYVALLASEWPLAGGFGSLAEVTVLFSNEWVLLAGWIHYLAFDFLIGCWILETAKALPLRHWLVVPTLALTFLFGPAGYLVFQLIRTASRPAPALRSTA